MAHDHNSDPAMDKALRRSLRDRQGAPGRDCPDASILAAYFDHELAPAEAERWDAHFSICARCQEQLAVLARTEPAVAEAHGAEERAGWRSFWKLRWLAPLATAAAAVLLWVVIRPAPPTLPPPEPAVATQQAPPATEPLTRAKPGAEADKVARVAEADKAILADKRALPGKPPAAPAPAQQVAQLSKAEIASTEKKDAGTLAAHAQPDVAARNQAQAVVVAEAAQDEMKVQQRADAAAAPAEAARSKMAAAEVQKAAPVAGQAPAVGEAAGRFEAPKGLMALRASANIVASPQGNVVWRFGANGLIERSTDAGKTWIRQLSPVTVDLITGSAPSEKVCWAIGASGTILRTTDGEYWERLASPTTANLRSIKARDALRATVTTADGQAFVTSDGGQTWRK